MLYSIGSDCCKPYSFIESETILFLKKLVSSYKFVENILILLIPL